MEVQSEVYLDSFARVELLAGPTGRRSWPDETKSRLVAESFLPGASVREVAERNGLLPNHLSTWRGLAKRGKLVVPDLAGADFATVVLDGGPRRPSVVSPTLAPIELQTGGVTLRLDANTDIQRLSELVLALKAAS